MDPVDAVILFMMIVGMCYLTFRFITFVTRTFKNALKAINDDDALDDKALICNDCYMYITDTLESEVPIDFSRDCQHCGTKFSYSVKKHG